MKDKVMMMYDHIRTATDIDPWAINEFRRVLDAYLADGCVGCAHESTVEWELPCRKCQRNSKDYYRRAEE